MTFVMFRSMQKSQALVSKENTAYVLILCLLSRGLSSIYYIEDVDSLRFALALKDFDLSSFQAHFPGYYVFCMLGKFFYLLTDSIALSFSLVGGLSVFGLMMGFSTVYRYFFYKDSAGSILLMAMIFLNPLIWLMSNRYMADMMGLGMLGLTVAAFIRCYEASSRQWMMIYYILLGLLAGVRLSYVPFFLPLTIWLLWNFRKDMLWQIAAGIFGVAVWLGPMIADTGWDELIRIAQSSTSGHFNEWGGTIQTDAVIGLRFVRMFQYTWADGLGNYWPGRHWITVLSSFGFISGFFYFFKIQIRIKKAILKWLISPEGLLCLSLLTYAIWAFLYQNVLFKSRHLMPFIPFALLAVSRGLSLLVGHERKFAKALLIVFLSTYTLTTAVLVIQHRDPTAISQLKNMLAQKQQEQEVYVLADRLIGFYMNRQLPKPVKHLSLDTPAERVQEILRQGGTVYAFERQDHLTGYRPHDSYTFYHNPYVNRLWSEINVYEY
jgi:hypothetical protein